MSVVNIKCYKVWLTHRLLLNILLESTVYWFKRNLSYVGNILNITWHFVLKKKIHINKKLTRCYFFFENDIEKMFKSIKFNILECPEQALSTVRVCNNFHPLSVSSSAARDTAGRASPSFVTEGQITR